MYSLFSKFTSLLLSFSIILLIAGCSGTDTVKTKVAKINVPAIQIFTDFKNNEVAAKEKYGNKVIATWGKVAKVENYGDGTIVLLNDGNPKNVGVDCHFNEDQIKSVAKLNQGQLIKVIGVGGSSLSIDYNMYGCRIKEQK